MNKILERIESAKHIVVISHIDPNADSISSASAFYTYLLRLHKKISFFCVTKEINQNLSFLPWFEKIRSSFPSSADLAIALNCGDKSRIGVAIECDLINIDHHSNNDKYGDFSLVDNSCISTTQVLFNFFKENNISINKKMATALYAGILDETFGFMDESTDGTVFAMISELIACGAEYKLCNDFIMKRISLGAFRLKAIMYKNMHLENEAKIAVFCVSDDDMKSSGALGEDCESVLKEALFLPSVEVALLLKQNSDLSIRGSLRSTLDVDVLKIASSFDGDGDTHRAGFNIKAPLTLDDAKKKVLEIIYKEM